MSWRPRILVALLGLAPGLSAQGLVDRPDPSITTAAWNGHLVVSGRILVAWDPGVDGPSRRAQAEALDCDVAAELPGGQTLLRSRSGAELPTILAAAGRAHGVRGVQPDALLTPLGAPGDPLLPQQWGLVAVSAAQAWQQESGAPGTVIAVLDSGASLGHPDLVGKIAWGLDTYAGDAVAADSQGHGTHCAGIAAAATGNGLGMAGGAGQCRLAVYRCGNATFPTSALLLALDDAVKRGARVLSLSWGSSYDNPALRAALLEAWQAGCVVVAAAGNDGTTAPSYPAAWPFVLAVASSTPSDGRSAFSNHGSWVDLAAPGQSILSTWVGPGAPFATLNGTSMACPLVAAGAGLLYARLSGPRCASSAALVVQALTSSAAPVGTWVSSGRLDLAAAIVRLDDLSPPTAVAVAAPDHVAPGHELVLDVTAPPGSLGLLLLSTGPQTMAWKGQAILVGPLVLSLGSVPASGRVSLAAMVPADLPPGTLWIQAAAIPAPGQVLASPPAAIVFGA